MQFLLRFTLFFALPRPQAENTGPADAFRRQAEHSAWSLFQSIPNRLRYVNGFLAENALFLEPKKYSRGFHGCHG
jgi:hypothetical protein